MIGGFLHEVRLGLLDLEHMASALLASVAATLLALLTFGYVKGRFTTTKPFHSAWQTAAGGALAAAAAFLIARAIA